MDGGDEMLSVQQSILPSTTFAELEEIVKSCNVRIAGGGVSGWTILMQIVRCGNLQLAKDVVNKYGFFLVCLGNQHGETPMHVAAALDDEDLALQFVRFFHGLGDVANFNICNESGVTPLEVAFNMRHSKVMSYLVESCKVEDMYEISQLHFKERVSKK